MNPLPWHLRPQGQTYQFRPTKRSSFPSACDRSHRWSGMPTMRSSLAWLACGQPSTETHPVPIGECHGELWRRPYAQDPHRHSGLFSVAGEPILKPPARTTIISGLSLAHSRKLASCFSARSASGLSTYGSTFPTL
jgi:hypothetical protein